MRRTAWFAVVGLALAVLHFALTMGLLFVAGAQAMRDFDAPEPPTWWVRPARAFVNVMHPSLGIADSRFAWLLPAAATKAGRGYPILFGESLVWGFVGAGLVAATSPGQRDGRPAPD